jgi:uncharacterized protein
MATRVRPTAYLVVAHSARMLAQSASRGGHRVCALDLFNDRDTACYARSSEAVDARAGDEPGFEADDLLRRADRLCPASDCLGLVYGAGFEDDTATLARLARGRRLLGNAPDLVRRLKDPAHFFGLLDRLSIGHPDTQLEAPADRRGWLYKRCGGTGGRHVVDALALAREPAPGRGYFQRRMGGRSLSMLFLADGRRAGVIGISEQLTLRHGPFRYTYAGALGPVPVPRSVSRRLRDAVAALVGATGLVGCNSLDFLLDGDRARVLEINPRPSATLDLYDEDWPAGLFDAHVRACRGTLPSRWPRHRPRIVRGHAIVHAAAASPALPPIEFPRWCSDLPPAGSALPPGAPACTVHAAAQDAARARSQLGRRRRQVQAQIEQELIPEDRFHGARRYPSEREPPGRAAGRVAA